MATLALVCLLNSCFLSDSAHDIVVNLSLNVLLALKRRPIAYDCQPAWSCWQNSHFLPFCALRAATAGLLPARLPLPNGSAGFCPAFLAPSGAGVSLGFAAEPFTSLLCPLVRMPCHAAALDRTGAPIFAWLSLPLPALKDFPSFTPTPCHTVRPSSLRSTFLHLVMYTREPCQAPLH